MLSERQIDDIQRQLFPNTENNIYAIIDGAACPELRFKLYRWQPVYSCLWSGKLEPDLEEVAPYMVKLERGAVFTEWLIKEGWGKHWNIFVETPLAPAPFRKQIRKLQLVKSPEGKTLLFRFYDPRVIEMFIPTCEPEQLDELFSQLSYIAYCNLTNQELEMCRFDPELMTVNTKSYKVEDKVLA